MTLTAVYLMATGVINNKEFLKVTYRTWWRMQQLMRILSPGVGGNQNRAKRRANIELVFTKEDFLSPCDGQ